MTDMTVKIKLLPHGTMPIKMTEGSSGFDIINPTRGIVKYTVGTYKYGALESNLYLIPLGFALEIPSGYEGQLRLRSSAAKQGYLIPNAPATIDSDYRGEVCLLVQKPNTVELAKGDRIAQLIFQKVPQIKLLQVDELSDTIRGSGGFGSTNV